jgi:hypothetical protein
METKSFLGLFDWMLLSEELKAQHHEQIPASDGLDRLTCPIATVGGHDICGWGVPMQVFRNFIMKSHLYGAGVLILLIPYQLFFSKKGSTNHKRVGFLTTLILMVQAAGGSASLILQAVRYYSVMEKQDLPPEYGYVLTPDSKFVFLIMFAMGFITPILNGLGNMVLKIPHKFNAIVTLLTLVYGLFYAFPVMISRLLTHHPASYDFQILFELICIAPVYPIQDLGNCLKYYDLFYKGKEFNKVEHHLNNVKMLSVVAMTAVFWFGIHTRIEDGEDQWPIPTFYRIVASYIPFLIMIATGSFREYLVYFYFGGGKSKSE